MHNILKTLFGADAPARAATGPASPAQPIGEPAPASAVGEAFGPLVQCHADRFTINGTGYPRRNLETRARPAFPRDLRTALGGVFADDADAKALVPERSEIFLHITPGMAAILGRIAELEQHPRLKTFVMLTGPTGCGKTTMVKTYCHFANEPCVELTFSGDTTLADFFRRTEVVRAEGGQSTVAALGPAVRAMVFGHKLLINEINMLPPDLLSVLTQAMDTGRLVLAGTDLGNIAIAVHERFGIFATANVNYVGTAEIGRALHRRFGMGLGNIPMTFLPPAEEAAAVAFEFNRTPLFAGLDVHINPSIVDRVVGVANALRDHPDHGGQLRDRISTRSLVHWLTLARTTGLPLAEVAQRAVLATAPDDAYAPALELTRRALGTATASVAYPEAFRRAVLGPDAPPEGAAAAVPAPLPASSDGALPQDGGAGVTTVALADGRQAGIRLRPGRPPLVTARTRTGEPIFDIDPVYRALREEFELGLAQPLGRVPGPADGLPCLTRTTWTIVRLVQGALLAGRPVFLRGPTGCGKSALARTVARLWHLPVVEFSFTGETAKSDLTASRQLRGGVTEWSMQAFLEAASEGLFVIINEYNLAYPDVHSIVNGLFDKGGRLVLPDGRTVRAHPDFRLVATGYPEGPGVKPLNEAVENRFGAVLRMDYPPAAEELAVLRFVAGERVGCAALSAAVELADIGRTILAGTWDSHLRHALSKIPPDLAAAAAERVALTTAELVTLAQAGESTDEFARWYRRGVLEGAGADATRVLTAALAGYGLT